MFFFLSNYLLIIFELIMDHKFNIDFNILSNIDFLSFLCISLCVFCQVIIPSYSFVSLPMSNKHNNIREDGCTIIQLLGYIHSLNFLAIQFAHLFVFLLTKFHLNLGIVVVSSAISVKIFYSSQSIPCLFHWSILMIFFASDSTIMSSQL